MFDMGFEPQVTTTTTTTTATTTTATTTTTTTTTTRLPTGQGKLEKVRELSGQGKARGNIFL